MVVFYLLKRFKISRTHLLISIFDIISLAFCLLVNYIKNVNFRIKYRYILSTVEPSKIIYNRITVVGPVFKQIVKISLYNINKIILYIYIYYKQRKTSQPNRQRNEIVVFLTCTTQAESVLSGIPIKLGSRMK